MICQQFSLIPFPTVASLLITMHLREVLESFDCKYSKLKLISVGGKFTDVALVTWFTIGCSNCTVKLFDFGLWGKSSGWDFAFCTVFRLRLSLVSAVLWRHFTDNVFWRPGSKINFYILFAVIRNQLASVLIKFDESFQFKIKFWKLHLCNNFNIDLWIPRGI